jgi:hypothetical protein
MHAIVRFFFLFSLATKLGLNPICSSTTITTQLMGGSVF